MRVSLRSVLVSLIGLVALGGLVASIDAERGVSSATKTDQTTTGSVQLVIEFGDESRRQDIDVSVAHFAGTGWQLLEAGDIEVEGTVDYPSSFVCRLNGWPTRQIESCATGPSGRTGHWAYWVTSPELGDGWILSGVGAAAHRPECGQSEAWVWVPAGKGSTEVKPHTPIRVSECSR